MRLVRDPCVTAAVVVHCRSRHDAIFVFFSLSLNYDDVQYHEVKRLYVGMYR